MPRKKTAMAFFVTALCLARTAAVGAADDASPPDASSAGPPAADRCEDAEPAPVSDAGAQAPAQDAGKSTDTTQLQELVVEAQRPVSAASSRELRARDFMERPHLTIMQVLNNIPGLLVAQHQGGGKAPQWFLRGFDADHGTDVAVYADDMPINLVSHAHGQGYADPNFLIPEVIDRVELYKGPYFPQFGDFATAGAVKLITKEEFKENFVKAEGGSFDTMRYVLGASPQLGNVKTLFAGQAYHTNGPFIHPEELWRYNGEGRMTLDPTPDSKLSATVQGYTADWDASGQIPARLVATGQLDQFGAIDPSEGGRTDRENLLLDWRYTPTASDTWEVHGYAQRYKLRLWSDFTFFANSGLRFVQEPNGAIQDTGDGPVVPNAKYIPGDEIYQGDSRYVFGGRGSYTKNWFLADVPQQTQFALETRTDDVHIKLQRAVRRTSFFTVNEVYVREHSFSGYWAQQIFFTDWLRFEGGLRGDFYIFDVNNRLPNQAKDPNFDAVFLNGYTTAGLPSPKANLIVTPVENTELYLNFGRGFHSNDARSTVTGAFTGAGPSGSGVTAATQPTPLVKALGYEVGARTHLFDRLDLAAAAWNLNLGSELVFSGDAGTDEASSLPSRRYGVDFEARWQLNDWLSADYDLSWSHARFSDGGFVPLAVPIFMNGGLTADFHNGLTISLRGRYISDRAANETDTVTARGYYLIDLFGRYRWRDLELSLQLLNLTNTDWREAQFSDNSCVRSEMQSRNPAAPCYVKPGKTPVTPADSIHFTPGNPIGVVAGVTWFF
jgi:outer membrane receptor protein involved in Fe transport